MILKTFCIKPEIKILVLSLFLCCYETNAQQNQPYTATFIGRMGVDTVLVETYTRINNHLYGKAFTRVPEDYIGEFSIHFYPNGTIREFNVTAMNPSNSSLPFEAKSRAFEYRLNMNCRDDTCTYYNSDPEKESERIVRHAAKHMDFVGGWVPLISLMEWNCMRLAKTSSSYLPMKMINHNIGVYDIGIQKKENGIMIFGGPFLEYTKLTTNSEGLISSADGTGTPWNYIVEKHAPINIDEIARRMTKTTGIGIPSKTETISSTIKNSKITVTYGRPHKRGREIFGGIVPYDSLWRTGANGPTTIGFEKDIRFGKTTVPKGTYSVYTIPKPNEWLMILSSDLSGWPTNPDRTKDLYRISIPVKKGTVVQEVFTIELNETKSGGQIIFSWDNVIATADFNIR
ncbi:DUF2911 domain-containing protein [Pollutibacter soli]|uniref:DUF2911 domain-containing protein n=1 Tax=Pollutibacter soli TaxID=3034157 RepID=UPI0030139636